MSHPQSRTDLDAGLRAWLQNLFASVEVDRDLRLKVIGGCLLFYFHMTFHAWWAGAESLSTLGNQTFNYVPAPFLENYRWLVFMDLFQTKTYLYVLGLMALFGLFSLFLSRSSVPALCIMAWLFVNKLFFYLCDFRLFANYHHFHLLYTLVFLIAQDKLRFFRITLAVSYLMSAVVKFSPSWWLGEYFNSLPNRLPLFPKLDWVVTAACLGVIALELLGPLCWLTRVRWLRRLSFAAFVVFHIYSGFIVGFWYTTLMLPVVVAAFWGFDEPLFANYRFSRRHWLPISLCGLALLGSVYHYLIPGDVRLTAEGRYFGLFMFDAHHAVRFETTIQKGGKRWDFQVLRNWETRSEETTPDSRITCVYHENDIPVGHFRVVGTVLDGEDIIFNPAYFNDARMRMSGDPYLYYYFARELIRRCQPDRVSLFMEQRLDGRPEATTLIDIPDFETRNPSYHPFRHNSWILLPGD